MRRSRSLRLVFLTLFLTCNASLLTTLHDHVVKFSPIAFINPHKLQQVSCKQTILLMSIFSINYSALTLDDLHHPTLVRIYSIYWDISLLISTIFFIFVLYTILKKSSTEMKEYAYYLIHQLTWSFLFNLHLGLWKPVPLWPFYLGYSVGLYSSIPSTLSMLPLIGVTFFSVGMGFSIYISVLHRYVQASPLSEWYKKYSNLYVRFIHYVVIFLIVECGLCLPLWIFRPDNEKLRDVIISQAKYMEFFFNEYLNIFGFAPEMNGGDSIRFVGGRNQYVSRYYYKYYCVMSELSENFEER